MAPPTLQSLPPELFLWICKLVTSEHLPSLVALASVSKHCYAIASTELYRSIALSVPTLKGLADSVQQYEKRLKRDSAFRHVSTLIVAGQGGFAATHIHHPEMTSQTQLEPLVLDAFLQYSPDRYSILFCSGPTEAFDGAAELWTPLANLIRHLSSLSDLIFYCPARFPSTLLKTLHQRRPQCRIHLASFNLRCMDSAAWDPEDYELATSPCLSSIAVEYASDTYDGEQFGLDKGPEYTEEAVMHIVAHLAPNLKYVSMRNMFSFPADLDSYRGPRRKPWRQHGQLNKQHRVERGLLRCLALDGPESLSVQGLQEWSHHTRLDCLQSLRLEGCVDQRTLAALAEQDFRSLQALYLNIDPPDESPPRDDVAHGLAAEQFICHLPPLASIELYGDLRDVPINHIASRHGQVLSRLAIRSMDTGYYPFTLHSFQQIRDNCPSLEDLTITLRRSRGDSTEARQYQSLGSLPRLQFLTLTMDASNPTIMEDVGRDDTEYTAPSDPSFDNFCQEFIGPYLPRRGHIRDVFINAALDETLARAMFWAISAGKPKNALPLKTLAVSVVRSEDLGGTRFQTAEERAFIYQLRDICAHLSLSWLVERSPNEDQPGLLRAKERPNIEYWGTRDLSIAKELDQAYEPIFQYVWPSCVDSGWLQGWHSFPLSAPDDESAGETSS